MFGRLRRPLVTLITLLAALAVSLMFRMGWHGSVYVQTAHEAEEVYDIYQADKDDEQATDLTLLFPVTSEASDLPEWATGVVSIAVPGHDRGKLCTRKCWMVAGGTAFPTLATRVTEALILKKPPVPLQALRASSFVVRASFDQVFGVSQAGIIDDFRVPALGHSGDGLRHLRRLWKNSGQLANGTRWFIDLVGVQWVPWSQHEAYSDYAARVAGLSKLGLVLGRGLGLRVRARTLLSSSLVSAGASVLCPPAFC